MGNRYLIDTNIPLTILLKEEKSEIAKELFQIASEEKLELYITEFSIHSIGITLGGRKKFSEFNSFLDDINKRGIKIVRLETKELKEIAEVCKTFKFDFDDAYQYLYTKKKGLILLTWDKDFLEKRAELEIQVLSPEEFLELISKNK